MNDCRIVEDLLPLYEEDLLHKETVDWIDTHLSTCESCRSRANETLAAFPAAPIKPKKTAAAMMKNVRSKLAIYQLLFVLLSFAFAMSTSIFADSFQFILSYFLLGFSTFYFYRSWIFTILISMMPIIIWSIYDTIASYGSYHQWYTQALENHGSVAGLFGMLLGSSLLMGIIHTLFAALGAVVALLTMKITEKEESL